MYKITKIHYLSAGRHTLQLNWSAYDQFEITCPGADLVQRSRSSDPSPSGCRNNSDSVQTNGKQLPKTMWVNHLQILIVAWWL